MKGVIARHVSRPRRRRPLEFAATDLHAFASFGIAAFMRDKKGDFLWLGNPYVDQPLPPLPGRPWQPEETSVAAAPR